MTFRSSRFGAVAAVAGLLIYSFLVSAPCLLFGVGFGPDRLRQCGAVAP